MTQPDFEQLAQDYLDFVKGFPRAVFPVPPEASEVDIVRANYGWPSPRDIASPLKDLDRAHFPQIIRSLANIVKREYSASTAKTLGYKLCNWMLTIEGRTPALLEGNYGDCMEAIESNLDMADMRPIVRSGWMDPGEETRLDEVRAMAHTYARAPSLFAPLYMGKGNTIEMVLATLGRIESKDLKPSYVQQHRYERLMDTAPDVPMFMTVAMNMGQVNDTNARHVCQVLGLLEDWGVEEPQDVEANKLNEWREAINPSIKLNPTQAFGKSRLDKMTLGAISQKSARLKPAKASKTPKM